MGLSDNVLHAQGVRLVYYNSRANLLLLEVGNIPHSYQPAYLGAYGWVGIALPAPRAARRAWAEIAELVDESYRNTAGKRLVAELDARG